MLTYIFCLPSTAVTMTTVVSRRAWPQCAVSVVKEQTQVLTDDDTYCFLRKSEIKDFHLPIAFFHLVKVLQWCFPFTMAVFTVCETVFPARAYGHIFTGDKCVYVLNLGMTLCVFILPSLPCKAFRFVEAHDWTGDLWLECSLWYRIATCSSTMVCHPASWGVLKP